MMPFGAFRLVVLALEGLAYALNPKLRKQESKKNVALSGLAYIACLLVGVGLIVMVVWELYFRK